MGGRASRAWLVVNSFEKEFEQNEHFFERNDGQPSARRPPALLLREIAVGRILSSPAESIVSARRRVSGNVVTAGRPFLEIAAGWTAAAAQRGLSLPASGHLTTAARPLPEIAVGCIVVAAQTRNTRYPTNNPSYTPQRKGGSPLGRRRFSAVA